MKTNYITFQIRKYTLLKDKYIRKIRNNSKRSRFNRLNQSAVNTLKTRVFNIEGKLDSLSKRLINFGLSAGVIAGLLLNSTESSGQIFDSNKDSTITLPGTEDLTQIKPNLIDMDDDGDLDILLGGTHDRPNTEPWYFYGVFIYYENTTTLGSPITFAEPVINPFGLDSVQWQMLPTVADLDLDGDLDILASDGDKYFLYYENTAGPGNTPQYAASQQNPFGLTDLSTGYTWYCNSVVSDFDNDGDMDVMSGEVYGDFIYFENTAGLGNTPAFGPLVRNPFGLTSANKSSSPTLYDIDNDGDLDLLSHVYDENSYHTFAFYENTAGANNPSSYAPAVNAPFGLPTEISTTLIWQTLGDIDQDGDFDILHGTNGGGLTLLSNREIILNTSEPTFETLNSYPNPVSSGSILVCDQEDIINSITITNSMGLDIVTIENVTGDNTFRLPDLVPGNYTIKGIGDRKNFRSKVNVH